MAEPERIPDPHEPHSADAPEPRKLRQNNIVATFSLILGVVGIFPAFGLFFGPLAIIFGGIGIFQASRTQGRGKWQAIAGIALGAIDIAIFGFLG